MSKSAQSATPNQVAYVSKRIEHALCRQPDFPITEPLGNRLAVEDFDRVKQVIWDEYQLQIETIDSIRDIAYMLQKKLEAKSLNLKPKT